MTDASPTSVLDSLPGDGVIAADGSLSDLSTTVPDANRTQADAPGLPTDAGEPPRDMALPQDAPISADTPPARSPNGATCSRRQDCASNSCSPDGHCCDDDCTSPCEACDVPGDVGRCSRVPSGQPHAKPACPGSGECAARCDGSSPACVFPTAACGTASCSGHLLTQRGTCNGAGMCLPGGSQDCGQFGCTGGGCKTTCSSDGDCSTGNYCAGASGCVPRKLPGTNCFGANQCASGFCSDQVCCNEACTGTCKGCASGTCVAIDGNVDPDNCHTSRFCGTAAYSGQCILGLILSKNGGLVPQAFYTFSPLFPDESAVEMFTLTRAPGVSTTTPMVRITGTNTDKFALTFDGCSNSPLPPGDACVFSIRFNPQAAGSFSAIVEATDSSGNKTNMAVTGQTR
jgi:hypothetical protein